MLYTTKFNAARLSLARMRRRLNAKSLADNAGVSADTVYRLEKGLHEPDDITVRKLATYLNYPVSFFFDPFVEEIDTDAVSFRSFSKLSAKERDAAISAGSLGLQLNGYVEARFNLPSPDLLDMSHEESPEIAALSIRQYWSLGERPIANMLAVLETKGVRVFSLSEDTASVNAFSFWRDDKPYVFLNNFKTAESSIFDAAHELGHLVMHKHGGVRGVRSVEREANDFASAFLMPERDLKSHLPRFITVDAVLNLKFRWRVSAMALARRIYSVGRLSEWQYKSMCIELARRNYRSAEPMGIERETSIVWKKILTQLWSERVTKHDIAKELNLPVDELEGLIWGLTHIDRRPDPREAGPLSLVS